VLLIMTDNGLFQVTTNEFRMGVDASVARRPDRRRPPGFPRTFNFRAPTIYSFSRTRGLLRRRCRSTASIIRPADSSGTAPITGPLGLDAPRIIIQREGQQPRRRPAARATPGAGVSGRECFLLLSPAGRRGRLRRFRRRGDGMRPYETPTPPSANAMRKGGR